MVKLIEQSRLASSNCVISVVVSNKEGVAGLEKARAMGVNTVVIPHGEDRVEFEKKVTVVRTITFYSIYLFHSNCKLL